MRYLLLLCLCTSALHAGPCCDDPLCERPDHPLTLTEAEDIAIRNNKAIRSLRQIAEQGQYRVLQAQAEWYPQVNYFPLARWRDVNSGSSELYQSVLNFTQNIFDTQRYYDVRLSKIDEELLCTDFAILKNEVRYLVRTAYYNVILQKGQTEVQSENVEILQDALKLEERKFAVGESTRFDVNQAKVSYANALSDYFLSRRNHKAAKNNLLQLLGYDPNGDLLLAEDEMDVHTIPLLDAKIKVLTEQQREVELEKATNPNSPPQWANAGAPFSKEEKTNWEEMALSCQPQIHKRILLLDFEQETKSKRYGEYWPSLQGFGNHILSNSAPSRTYEAGVTLSWKLFDGFARSARVQEAKLAVCSAEIELQKIVQDNLISLHDRFDEIEEAVLSYYAAKESVALAEQAIELAKARRELGVITPIEYREVTASLTQARQDFNRASFALLRSYYLLRQEAGADFRDECNSEAV